jgi:FkbM family methyltransferase
VAEIMDDIHALVDGGRALQTKVLRYLQAGELARQMAKFQAAGITFQTVYDIGAYRGEWSQGHEMDFPDAVFHLFDPHVYCQPLHEPPRRFFHQTLLSDEARDVDFYLTGGTGDSYFKERTTVFENLEPTRIRAARLDEVVRPAGIPAPDFIKIDTQGSELDILRGAGDLVAGVKAIQIECPIVEYNRDAPTLPDYVAALGDLNMSSVALLEPLHFNNVLIQADILFVSRDFLGARKVLF